MASLIDEELLSDDATSQQDGTDEAPHHARASKGLILAGSIAMVLGVLSGGAMLGYSQWQGSILTKHSVSRKPIFYDEPIETIVWDGSVWEDNEPGWEDNEPGWEDNEPGWENPGLQYREPIEVMAPVEEEVWEYQFGAEFHWDSSISIDGPLENVGTAGAGFNLGTAAKTVPGATMNGLPTRGILADIPNGLDVSLGEKNITRPHIFIVYRPRQNLWDFKRLIFRDQDNGYNLGQYKVLSDELTSTATSGANNKVVIGGGIGGTAYIVEAYLPPSGEGEALLSVSGSGKGPKEYARFSRQSDHMNVLQTVNVAGAMYDESHSSAIDLAELVIFNGDVEGYDPLNVRKPMWNHLMKKWLHDQGGSGEPTGGSYV